MLFLAASKQELKRTERALTREAEGTGLILRNIQNASITSGVDALDELLNYEAQEQWRRDPARFNAADNTPLKELAAQSVRYSTAARRYLEREQEPATTALLRTFVDGCIPAPRATEFQYWSVSTGTYASSPTPRRFCVSVGKMEVFVLFANKNRDGRLGGFVNVRKSALDKFVTSSELLKRHPSVSRRERSYEDGGGDTITLHCNELQDLMALVADADVTRAAGALVLDLMRKHFCVYTRYHCPQLTERIYPDHARPVQSGGHTVPAVADVDASLVRSDDEAATALVDNSQDPGDVERLGDVELFWVVSPGSQASKKNQVADFLSNGEWRMEPHSAYESKVADMRVGERIAVRTRRNITDDVPFDNRGLPVSVMDFHLRGVVSENPGDGCSVKVRWEAPQTKLARFYLYTSQDTVWPMALEGTHGWRQVIRFAFFDERQDIDSFRNAPFWRKRFGDPARH